MTPRRRSALLTVAFLAAALCPSLATLAAPPPKPQPTPAPVSSLQPGQTPVPAAPLPASTSAPTAVPSLPAELVTPTPSGVLVRYAGEILDVRNGYIFFTTGDGFRLDPNVRKVDYFTGAPTAIPAELRIYARAAFDPTSHRVVELGLSRRPIPPEASYEAAHVYAITQSPYLRNPELDTGKTGLTGRPVLVTFTVLVPASTNISDSIYIETDQSGWNPQAIKLDRIDALHYRITLRMPSGTEFLYRFTRGSSQSVERARNGLEQPARRLLVPEADVKNQDDTVYNWADTNPSAGGNSAPGPDAIPTPFNPAPFPFPVPRKTLKP